MLYCFILLEYLKGLTRLHSAHLLKAFTKQQRYIAVREKRTLTSIRDPKDIPLVQASFVSKSAHADCTVPLA